MKKVKVVLELELKTDPEDDEQLQADLREELQGLLDDEDEIDVKVIDEEEDEEEEDED